MKTETFVNSKIIHFIFKIITIDILKKRFGQRKVKIVLLERKSLLNAIKFYKYIFKSGG